jgi:hypothetical protein
VTTKSKARKVEKVDKPHFDQLRDYLAPGPMDDMRSSHPEITEALTLIKYAPRGPEGAQAHAIANRLLIKAAVDIANDYQLLEISIVRAVDLLHRHLVDTLRLDISGGKWELPTVKAG